MRSADSDDYKREQLMPAMQGVLHKEGPVFDPLNQPPRSQREWVQADIYVRQCTQRRLRGLIRISTPFQLSYVLLLGQTDSQTTLKEEKSSDNFLSIQLPPNEWLLCKSTSRIWQQRSQYVCDIWLKFLVFLVSTNFKISNRRISYRSLVQNLQPETPSPTFRIINSIY